MNDEEKMAFLRKMGYGGSCVRTVQGLKNDFPKKRKLFSDNEVAVEDLKLADRLMNPKTEPE